MGQRRGLEIRAATGTDAAGLSTLLGDGRAWLSSSSSLHLAARLEDARNGAGTVLIALDWGPPVGLVALHWYASLTAALPVAQIDMLLVGDEDRRRGIGRLLVKAAAQAARVAGCGAIVMAVRSDQADVHGFCLATGFVEAGRRFERALRKGTG